MTLPSNKILWLVAGLVMGVVLIAAYFYFPRSEKGAVGTAKTLSESVPEIQTNPGEKVPEINPLDRANPFKYNNPLR